MAAEVPEAVRTCKALIAWGNALSAIGATSLADMKAAPNLAARRAVAVEVVQGALTSTNALLGSIGSISRSDGGVRAVVTVEDAITREFERVRARLLAMLPQAEKLPIDSEADFDAAKARLASGLQSAGGGGVTMADLGAGGPFGASFIATLAAEPTCFGVFA